MTTPSAKPDDSTVAQFLFLILSLGGGAILVVQYPNYHFAPVGAVLAFAVLGSCFVTRTREDIEHLGGTAYYVGFMLTLVALPQALAGGKDGNNLANAFWATGAGALALALCRVGSLAFPRSTPAMQPPAAMPAEQITAAVTAQLSQAVTEIAQELSQVKAVLRELSVAIASASSTNAQVLAGIGGQTAALEKSVRQQAGAIRELETAIAGLTQVVADALLNPLGKESASA